MVIKKFNIKEKEMKQSLTRNLILAGVFLTGFCTNAIAEKTTWHDSVTVSGAVEVEASTASDYNGDDSSDISLATMELGIVAVLSEQVTGSLVLLWEEDATEPVDLDEAIITLGRTETQPLFMVLGKTTAPFGAFETNMLSDPMTLEIGETSQSLIQAGFEKNGLHLSAYTYKGDVTLKGDDETIKCFGASTSYTMEQDAFTISLGAGINSNIIDSDGLGDSFTETRNEFIDTTGNTDAAYELNDAVIGYTVNAMVSAGPVSLIAEYVAAGDDPEYYTNDGVGTVTTVKADAPSAWHVEAAFTFPVSDKEITTAATVQGSDNMAGTLPENRYGFAVGAALTDNLGLTAEYIIENDYSVSDGGTDDDASAMTVQLALEF